ncbi:phosphonate ABC transporter, permease protein PhnE [Clostridium sp. 'deep sea']|uniref:phosphonate ABC transporter, permease protein PhnE n=1 Tax=Clostridium sp. 'deep sea' TaxID=2779445 RepID=UPI0018969746|nr:phosphonate ABC transporter, permease protein PhnE [Clostridium sp. 'deep sea']QOR34393.1 phosphonate ABC transporter, permease protein PhnE [Clostridium sp. 'deep sea']
MSFIKRIFVPDKITLSNKKQVTPPRPIAPYILIALFAFTYVSVVITGFDIKVVFTKFNQFFIIIKKMFPPDWSYTNTVLDPLLDTVKMSLLGSMFGSFFAIPFAVLSSTNINGNKFLLSLIRFFLSIIRTVPTLIIALVATYIFDLGTFAGSLAIGIFTFAIVAKMLYEKIETVDMGPFEAMESLGASKVQAFVGAIMPQILPTYLSIALYSLEINVRHAAILGYVGAGGIGILLDEKLSWREYSSAGMVIFMLFITVLIIEGLSRFFRKRLA